MTHKNIQRHIDRHKQAYRKIEKEKGYIQCTPSFLLTIKKEEAAAMTGHFLTT